MRLDRLVGAVLAGGESRRFGRDKAVERVAGQPLVVRAARTLAEVFDPVVVVSSGEPAGAGWRHIPDLRRGAGPLGGIEAALAHAEELGRPGAFVLACDLPLVDAATVRHVVDAGRRASAPACAPVRDGRPGFEPLCAVYRVSCLREIREALDQGARAVHEAFTSVGGATVPVRSGRFLNVNRPEDAERAAAALDGEGRRSAARSSDSEAGGSRPKRP